MRHCHNKETAAGHRHHCGTAHGTGILSSLMRHCHNKETAAGLSPSLQYCPLDRDSILLNATLSQQGNCSRAIAITAVLPTGQGFYPPRCDTVTTRKLQQGHHHHCSTAHWTGILSSLMRHCHNKETAAGLSPSLQYCPLDRDSILLNATLSQQGNCSRAIAITAVLP